MSGDQKLLRFVNCNIIRDHKIIREDIWVRGGRIVNPEKVFYEEQIKEDLRIDCKNRLIAPGFIEIQINGGYGFDFSYEDKTEEGLNTVANKLLEHGVTAFCPTVVTSPVEIYHKILPKLHYRPGNAKGATILGAHVEGPFINTEKKGAHPQECIIDYEQGIEQVESTYGSLENIRIVTLAPELLNSSTIIKKLKEKNIVVSLGHSTADLNTSEDALLNGASLITHLFNAMLPFHHRDPGLVGLLASDKISEKNSIYFGIIADGIHTHPSALRIAYRVHPEGLILVTDAISALGLHTGKHKIGQLDIEIKNNKAFIANTNTLCGSIATMIECVRNFILATGCPAEYALEAASLHPAQVLGIQDQKGTLNFGADADFIILTDDYEIASTWINGECVYELQHLFSNIDIGQDSDLPNSDTSNVIQRDSVTKNGNFNLIPNVLSNVANKSGSEVPHSGSNKQISKLHTENDDSSDLQRSLSSKTNSKIQQCSVASGNYSDLSHSILNVANKSNANL